MLQSETAKLAKYAGFDWTCDSFYSLDVRHNGESIDEDREYELTAAGKENEIEYVQCGKVYNFHHSNKVGEDYNGYSRPSQSVLHKWIREKYHMLIQIVVLAQGHEFGYRLITFSDECTNEIAYKTFESSYEVAYENGLQNALKIIIKYLNKQK